MKVIALVMYPVSVEIEVDDLTDQEEIGELVKKEANSILETSTIKPVIQDLFTSKC